MLEIPEAVTISNQITETLHSKVITKTIAAASPYKLAWYQGDPADYPVLLNGREIIGAQPAGGMVEITLDGANIILSEGAFPAFYQAGDPPPKKHQLMLHFTDGTFLAVSVRMYGGLLAFRDGEGDNPYYLLAKEKPSPLSDSFDRSYFDNIFKADGMEKLSAKAFLATEQRIPGLGNGTLQDILYNAGVHPKRKSASMSEKEITALFRSIKKTLAEMAALGERDTELDLFRRHGGYPTKCSKLTVGLPCGKCGAFIQKASYMGGSVYFCPACQPL